MKKQIAQSTAIAVEKSLKDEGPIQLPERIKLSERELCAVTRLVRLLRNDNVWLGAFIEYLLFRDADDRGDVSHETVKLALLKFENLRNWGNFLRETARDFPMLAQYTGLTSAQECGAICDHDDDLYELEKLWRKDYPKPEKRQNFPAGHLGREESGD